MSPTLRTLRGFTLIELLVVVTIIIALLAILLPSMGKSVEAAQRTVCGSQLHQHGTILLAYAADHRGSYPPSAPVGRWAFGHLSSDGSNLYPVGAALLYDRGYVPEPDIFYCPSTQVGAGISYRDHWRPPGFSVSSTNWSGTYIAYQYFAGYQAPGSVVLDHKDFAGPGVASSRGNILAMDLAVDDLEWWMSNHIDAESRPIGFNRLNTDQSVQWTDFDDRIGEWFHRRTFYY